MTQKTKTIFLTSILVLFSIVILSVAINQIYKNAYNAIVNQNLSGIGGPSTGTYNRFTTASSSSLTLVTGSANKILATTTSRAYAAIYNESSATVYLNINQGSTASSSYGIPIEANSLYEFIPGKNLYDGTVYASSTGAAVLHILEVTTDD